MKNRKMKIAMAQKGFLTQAELAEATGYSQAQINGVITGRLKSKRAKKIIALVLNWNFDELWERETDPSL